MAMTNTSSDVLFGNGPAETAAAAAANGAGPLNNMLSVGTHETFSAAPAVDTPSDKTGNQVVSHRAGQKTNQNIGYNDLKDVYNEELDTPGETLNPGWQNNNFAMNGRYGNLNQKSYDETLSLSRQADAYNNKPIDKIRQNYSYNAAGGSYGYGGETIGYDRPKIETQEMRQMRTNEALDKNQRMLDQQLQAAVNSKNYDAYKTYFKQKYGIQLSTYDALREMTSFETHQAIQNLIAKDQHLFMERAKLYFQFETARNLYQYVMSNNNMLAQVLLRVILGMPAPSRTQVTDELLDQQISEEFEDPQVQAEVSRAVKGAKANAQLDEYSMN